LSIESLVSPQPDSRLYNKDLAPTGAAQRTWTFYSYLSLWVGMAQCVPTLMMAGGMIALGMNWIQAWFTIILGNLIVLIPILLNSHPGTKYGIPFPVFARTSFGTNGANIVAVMRALVAAGWFGIESVIGGSSINAFLTGIIPAWANLNRGDFLGQSLSGWICFLLFWALNVYIIYHGMETVRKYLSWAAPIIFVLGVGLFVWSVSAAHGFGPLFEQPTKFGTFGSFMPVFIPSLTGVIAFWATLSLNIPDFTRFSKSQRDQMLGQTLGLPPAMAYASLVGIVATSASMIVFGKALWNPVDLLGHFHNPVILFLSLFAITVATLAVNVGANVVSPAYDISNLAPGRISFQTGGLITAVVGLLYMPWKLLASPHVYIFDWLGTYSGFLGPIAGVLIADYWAIRRTRIDVAELYSPIGIYSYKNGFNPGAVLALACGIVLALIGAFVPTLVWLYNYAWFTGFVVSFLVYWFYMKSTGVKQGRGVGISLGE